ncbi:Glutathione-binding protein gsiB precursor [Cedecea neteri]|uniref:Glutathione-binding protein gsiB n=1 Tax=Cedecea neteri TaxID=158822 RepID=A0A2X3KUM2_9ENTR|nr:Glutathione-binding protein gsiB precursor [Cedecea neteri]
MTANTTQKWLLAAGLASAVLATPAFAAKDVVVAVASNFTTLDPYDANDTLSQGRSQIVLSGAVRAR